jgi:hypothetical protein
MRQGGFIGGFESHDAHFATLGAGRSRANAMSRVEYNKKFIGVSGT